MSWPGRVVERVNTGLWQRVLRHVASREALDAAHRDLLSSQVSQRLLFHEFRRLAATSGQPLRSHDAGFRVYSQADEDGLLLYVFAAIGFTNRVCVDLGAGAPAGGNCTNLVCNWGFDALLVEGDASDGEKTAAFYRSHPDTALFPPKIVTAWITVENVNELIRSAGVEGDIDLLSLDLDGVDYWILKALTVVRPRVMVVEFQDLWGPEVSVTVPYRPDFRRTDASYDYCGASLAAFVKLCGARGYRLLGANRLGQNAFFVRDDIAGPALPGVPVTECFPNRAAVERYPERRRRASSWAWQEV